jgi:hypothetical protein
MSTIIRKAIDCKSSKIYMTEVEAVPQRSLNRLK